MSAETHVHNKDGELARSVCGQCNDAYLECTVCEVYFCDCSRATEDAQAAEKVALTEAEREVIHECVWTLLGEEPNPTETAIAECAVVRIVAARVVEAVDRERAAWADVEIEAFGRGVAWAGGDDIKAEVWDEGYLAGWDDRHADEDEPLPAGEQHDSPNPHRAFADDTKATS